MHTKCSWIGAGVVAIAVLPVGLLLAGVEASVARTSAPRLASVAKAPAVAVRKTSLGKILVAGASGRTLYLLTSDGKNKSTCTGACAQAWPPLLVSGKPTAGKGVSKSKLGEIIRGKSHQVTYAGHPLYEFAQDSGPGQSNGEGAGGFYVVSPSGKAIK
jgi:predicted lipoprotein with Yx(FWY)xxD motif